MSVRAKFQVQSVLTNALVKTTDPAGRPHEYHPTSVTLSPVYVDSKKREAGDTENALFGFYTPGGSIQMSIQNDDASSEFKPGAEFYVDFTRAE